MYRITLMINLETKIKYKIIIFINKREIEIRLLTNIKIQTNREEEKT